MDFARQRQASFSSCFLSVRLGEPLRLSEPGRSRTEESESAICGVDGRTRTIGPPSLPSPPPPFFLHLGDCGSVTGRDLGAVPPSTPCSLPSLSHGPTRRPAARPPKACPTQHCRQFITLAIGSLVHSVVRHVHPVPVHESSEMDRCIENATSGHSECLRK